MNFLKWIPHTLMVCSCLSGCFDKPTKIPFLDKVITVEEFNSQREMREKVLSFCSNNPGEVKEDPNCINAKQSVRSTTSGDGNFPKLDISPPASQTSTKK